MIPLSLRQLLPVMLNTIPNQDHFRNFSTNQRPQFGRVSVRILILTWLFSRLKCVREMICSPRAQYYGKYISDIFGEHDIAHPDALFGASDHRSSSVSLQNLFALRARTYTPLSAIWRSKTCAPTSLDGFSVLTSQVMPYCSTAVLLQYCSTAVG